jgi:indole-3-glycerol phosphate synthase
MSVLEAILRQKRVEVREARSALPLVELRRRAADAPPVQSFRSALLQKTIAIIAEVKKASPSRGVLTEQFDPIALAREYEEGGASAVSVLTDEQFFRGHKSTLQSIKAAVELPLLRKDFIIDEYQVYESRVIGADAILLIVGMLTESQFSSLFDCAREVGLDVLVETHTEEDVARANEHNVDIIGVNNRDLRTFKVSLQHSLNLRRLVRSGAVTVSESGIQTQEDVVALRKAGFDAVLIGEGLVASSNRVQLLREFLQA